MTPHAFQKKIYEYYKKDKRDLPWRNTHDPYKILVSELMLQQTQSTRVIEKYKHFIKIFPTATRLARASTQEVLLLWQGLGYNRRALYLHRAAQVVTREHHGIFPTTEVELQKLPGVGPYTAAAIMAFAYNKPTVVIETNIRAVFIHFFFPTSKKVSDATLVPFIEKFMDKKNPREWYNALMDYGALLKRTVVNPSRKSKTHVKQSAFKGSLRQIRGAIIKEYTENSHITKTKLTQLLPYKKEDIIAQYNALKNEGFFR